MSDKKTLLEEGTIRRFMKLANMGALGTGFVNEMYGKMKDDKEELDEKRRKKEDDLEEGKRKDDDKLDEEVDIEEMMHGGKMADDDTKDDEKKMEEDVDIEEEMHGGAMADDMEMDLDVKDEEEEMDMDAGDMGELTLTDEEAEVFLKVADKVRAAMEVDAPAEELPAPDMGDVDEPMDEPADEPMMEDMVNEVARRVAKRLKGLKKSK